MRWFAVMMLVGCSSHSEPEATSSYDCNQPFTHDIASRTAAESACASVRRAGRLCHVCVESVDDAGRELTFAASESADPCGCAQPEVKTACRACNESGGVKVCVSADSCVLESGVGGTFTYEVTVSDAAPVLHTAATGPGCATCASWSSDPMSFVTWSIGAGSVHYCACDSGCCLPQEPKTITLDRGTKSATIVWPGRQWNGPSDTGEVPGAPFPPGSYAVTVVFHGAVEAALTATLPITVIE